MGAQDQVLLAIVLLGHLKAVLRFKGELQVAYPVHRVSVHVAEPHLTAFAGGERTAHYDSFAVKCH